VRQSWPNSVPQSGEQCQNSQIGRFPSVHLLPIRPRAGGQEGQGRARGGAGPARCAPWAAPPLPWCSKPPTGELDAGWARLLFRSHAGSARAPRRPSVAQPPLPLCSRGARRRSRGRGGRQGLNTSNTFCIGPAIMSVQYSQQYIL
jgi:hypothetical protein